MNSVDIYEGDARAVLARLPESSFQCCITSPPYWGLREYGTEPQVWGGDPDCAHVWIDRKRCAYLTLPPVISGFSCGRCGAWRGELGLEPTLEMYIEHLVECFRAVRRVLREDGTCWIVIGDGYAGYWGQNYARKRFGEDRTPDASVPPNKPSPNFSGSLWKPKDLLGVPWRVAFALWADGWWLRSLIIWDKPAGFPESIYGWRWVQHRIKKKSCDAKKQSDAKGARAKPAKRKAEWVRCPGCPKCSPNGGLVLQKGSWRPTACYEVVLLLAKSDDYYADGYAVRTKHVKGTTADGGNLRSVWRIAPQALPLEHYAAFPEEIAARIVKLATPDAGVCGGCGAPYARVVDLGATESGAKVAGKAATMDSGTKMRRMQENAKAARVAGGDHDDPFRKAQLKGWRPTCSCVPRTRPAAVLDPFLGSGTTALAAALLGRDATGIDLSAKFVEMARARVEDRTGVLPVKVNVSK